MKIIYIHQYFLTPAEGGAIRSYHLARGLVDAGLEVEMITAHNHNYYDLRIVDGIKVHYLPVSYDNAYGPARRALAFGRFVIQAKRLVRKLPRPDLFYISSTPLTTGLVGLWAKRKFAVPFIFEVRDLWPEAPIQAGVIRNKIIQKILYRLEKKLYLHALKVVALSPGIRNYIKARCADKEVFLVSNFCDLQFFEPVRKEASMARRWGLGDRFTLTYTGALGRINALHQFLQLANEAKSQSKDWQFVLMGRGAYEERLKRLAREMNLDNVFFFPFGDKGQVRELLSVSDISYISFDHFPVLQTNSPNKFFDALAMGKAILTNHKGWVNDLVREHRLGFYQQPGNPGETVHLLAQFADNPQTLYEAQQRARNLAVQYFSKETAIQKLLFVLDPNRSNGNANGEADIRIA
ncbi:MAG TPA: glycosyltransferase family 4 protein [Cyclobacteriaceae bacterium]|nr:glycosyltransferase family 4 protein [Cyclobacteriaceae bacterium]